MEDDSSAEACEESSMDSSTSSEKSESSYYFTDDEAEVIPDEYFYVMSAGDYLIKLKRTILAESAMIRKLSQFFDSMEEMANDPQGPCGTASNPFPLPSLEKSILNSIADWLLHHAPYHEKWRTFTDKDLANDPQNTLEWKGVRTTTVNGLFNTTAFFELFKAAEFLEMRSLVVACCKYLAFSFSRFTADELRRTFRQLSRDLTGEEEEAFIARILHLQIMLPLESDFGKDDAPLTAGRNAVS